MRWSAVAVMLSGMLVTAAASANAVYRWHTLQPSDTITRAYGEIEITTAAQRAGHARYEAPYCDGYTYFCIDPQSPIVRFAFTVNQPEPQSGESYWPGIDINVVKGTGLVFPGADWLNASFDITGKAMDLTVSANTGETSMQMTHNRIDNFSSDAPYFGDACFLGQCTGATGEWRLDHVIPEPSLPLLLGIGLAALGVRRRKA